MTENFEHFQSSVTSYFVGGIGVSGVISQADIMFALGALVMLVRLVMDAVRLFRYLRNPNHLNKQ